MKHKKKHRHRMIKTRGGWTACGVCGEEKAMKRRGRITDKMRLDWIQRTKGRFISHSKKNLWVVLGYEKDMPFVTDINANLRQAIDEAIKREGK